MKTKKTIQPPLGYDLLKECNADSENDVLELCCCMSDNKGHLDSIGKMNHKERLSYLKNNGFSIKTKYLN